MTELQTLKFLTVVGARPNFMKAAPILRAIRSYNETVKKGPKIQHILVHTGQHYDAIMSDRIFADLDMPPPDVHLGVAAGSPAEQTAEILVKFEKVLSQAVPDLVIVVGDVNSTVACALATAKTSNSADRARPLLAHIESGLRSFDRDMPEEMNRIVTDQLADLLFVTEKSGLANLRREGIPAKKVFFVGNSMIDSLLAFETKADESAILGQLKLCLKGNSDARNGEVKPYALLTLHRPSNVDDRTALRDILDGISEISREMPVVFPVHPRTQKRIHDFGLGEYFGAGEGNGATGIQLVDPLGYLDFVCMMKNARLVLTDSGGVQEETTCLRVPCVTLRNNTERPVTVTDGTNVIAGTSVKGIRKAIRSQITRRHRSSIPAKWDGQAARRIVPILVKAAEKRMAANRKSAA